MLKIHIVEIVIQNKNINQGLFIYKYMCLISIKTAIRLSYLIEILIVLNTYRLFMDYSGALCHLQVISYLIC